MPWEQQRSYLDPNTLDYIRDMIYGTEDRVARERSNEWIDEVAPEVNLPSASSADIDELNDIMSDEEEEKSEEDKRIPLDMHKKEYDPSSERDKKEISGGEVKPHSSIENEIKVRCDFHVICGCLNLGFSLILFSHPWKKINTTTVFVSRKCRTRRAAWVLTRTDFLVTKYLLLNLRRLCGTEMSRESNCLFVCCVQKLKKIPPEARLEILILHQVFGIRDDADSEKKKEKKRDFASTTLANALKKEN